MDYSIFAMQVVLPLEGAHDPVYRELHKLIRAAPERANYARMHDYYGRITQLLRKESHRFKLGTWDYWDDPTRAERDFQDWVDGLKGREARLKPAPEEWGQRHLACAVALLLQHHSTSDQRLLRHCDIPEEKLWSRGTFAHLLDGLKLLNFLHVQSDLVYLLPGSDAELGLTEEDLATADWDYLHPLV
jgi:REP element-mobilizing transposase RayT